MTDSFKVGEASLSQNTPGVTVELETLLMGSFLLTKETWLGKVLCGPREAIRTMLTITPLGKSLSLHSFNCGICCLEEVFSQLFKPWTFKFVNESEEDQMFHI